MRCIHRYMGTHILTYVHTYAHTFVHTHHSISIAALSKISPYLYIHISCCVQFRMGKDDDACARYPGLGGLQSAIFLLSTIYLQHLFFFLQSLDFMDCFANNGATLGHFEFLHRYIASLPSLARRPPNSPPSSSFLGGHLEAIHIINR